MLQQDYTILTLRLGEILPPGIPLRRVASGLILTQVLSSVQLVRRADISLKILEVKNALPR